MSTTKPRTSRFLGKKNNIIVINPSPAGPGYALPLQTASIAPDQLVSEEAS